MVRAPTIDSNGLTKGAWSEEEDMKLRAYVQRHGHPNWRQLPKFAGLARCGKSCRLRWKNYLRPGVRRGNYSPEEEQLLLRLHEEFGNKWSVIASYFPGRTDNEIKNHWHGLLRRRMKQESRSMNSTYLNTLGRFHHMDASEHNEESSSMTILDASSMTTFDSIQGTNNNIAAAEHAYSEVSSLSNDPTFFDGVLDLSAEDGMNLVEPIMEPFGETFWSQPCVLDTSVNNNNLPQQLPPLENEMMCPFSPYLDETDIDYLHELLQ